MVFAMPMKSPSPCGKQTSQCTHHVEQSRWREDQAPRRNDPGHSSIIAQGSECLFEGIMQARKLLRLSSFGI